MTEANKPPFPTGGRKAAAITFIIIFLASIVALIVAMKKDADYIIVLIIAFALFLSMFHMRYAVYDHLTQRQVRKIDDWYLGAAAVGMILFSLNYATQREVYVGKANQYAYRSLETKLVDEANAEYESYLADACSEVVINASKTACPSARSFRDKVKPGLTVAQLTEIEMSFRDQLQKSYRAVRDEYKKVSPRDIDPSAPYFLQAARFQVSLQQLQKFVADAPLTVKPATMREEIEVMLGLGQTVLWPFLLAFALALRITKVTIDVYEWAK